MLDKAIPPIDAPAADHYLPTPPGLAIKSNAFFPPVLTFSVKVANLLPAF
jgi:hypothetical protein